MASITTLLSDATKTLVVGSRYAVFTERGNRDLVVLGQCDAQRTPALYYGTEKSAATKDECLTLFAEIDTLTRTNAYASVSLPSGVVQKLKDSIKKLNATHLRFFNDGEKLRIVVFDWVKFHASYRLPRKTSNLVRYHDTLIVAHENFSATFLAQSFLKLPTESLQMRFGENGVTHITTDKGETSYLMRDQRMKEPMTVFHSKQIGQNIALVFHPK